MQQNVVYCPAIYRQLVAVFRCYDENDLLPKNEVRELVAKVDIGKTGIREGKLPNMRGKYALSHKIGRNLKFELRNRQNPGSIGPH